MSTNRDDFQNQPDARSTLRLTNPSASVCESESSNNASQKQCSRHDEREQLYNECKSGPITEVQLEESSITALFAIMTDVDHDPLNPKAFGVSKFKNADHFYAVAIRPMLARHPVLKKAQVRMTGRGLHVILRFKEPVEFKTSEERDEWALIVTVLQRMLPSDPNCPGITAVTRALGSINSKNNSVVKELNAGELIDASEVKQLAHDCMAKPFSTITSVLWGASPLSPCPLCKTVGSSLASFDESGKCYKCGKVDLYDVFTALGCNSTKSCNSTKTRSPKHGK